MARFSNDDAHVIQPALHLLATVAANAIAIEDRFNILKAYDTVFLIDDSPSMYGAKWELVQKILDHSTAVASRYDEDGIDVHFMNNVNANRDKIKDPEIAIQLHHGIELRGSTPTLDKLSRHLKGYLQRFKAANFSADFKGYNLILLTDGEPNEEYEDESDVSDQEDARKYGAAFRLIGKKIVEVAKKLDEADAEPRQVGIQFCQVGNDEEATVFFRYLDDRLKRKYSVGRSVSCPRLDVNPLLMHSR